MKLYTIKKYLKYILFASHKRGHGIHSPFVFNIVLKVFRNKNSSDFVCKIESIRKRLISDTSIIETEVFGTGSEIINGKIRRVSEIARYSSVPKKYGKLLARLAEEFGRSTIIEFGTSFGISTMYMAASSGNAIVYTMEESSEVSETARKNFADAGFTNIQILSGPFEKTLPEIEEKRVEPGLVFISGCLGKERVIKYFNRIADLSDDRTVIVIDNIYHSPERGEAWNEIRDDKRVSITIDIFRMGLVFFRKGMTRNEYIIRY